MEAARYNASERVRWSDVDVGGLIRWDAYTRFIELAETELFRAIGFPYATLWDQLDIWLPRVQFHLDLRGPARLDDALDTEIWVSRIGRSSVHLAFAMQNAADALVAEGHLVVVAVARRTGKSVAVPEALVRALKPYCEP